MADAERLYRALASWRLEERLADETLGATERAFIEKELRRRKRAERAANTPRRKPRYRTEVRREPAWWQHRICVFLLVYAVPFLAIEIWGYLGWKRFLEYRRFDHLDPLDLTLKSLYLPFRALGPWTLVMLLAMAAYAVRPRPATALVSFAGTALWCYFGHGLVGLMF